MVAPSSKLANDIMLIFAYFYSYMDAINSNVVSNIPLISLGFFLIFIYVVFMLGPFNVLQHRVSDFAVSVSYHLVFFLFLQEASKFVC